MGIVLNEQPDGGEEAFVPEAAAASPPAQATAPRRRQHFPETWVWTGDDFNTTRRLIPMPNPTGHWRFRPMYMQMRTGFAGGGERKLNEQPGMAGAPMPLQANVRKSSPSLLSVAPPPRQRKHFPERGFGLIWTPPPTARRQGDTQGVCHFKPYH
ncbi:hypothetical protein niasHT_036282 [Heterodera trifolii]|uniref:Uncharacterized protein n=1 Tax=Heterodera trifolii TaxID=157864 RepID=A0ABD2I0A9_9BILA